MSFNMGLSENQRQEMAKAVTAVLADTYALYFKTHVYHWNVTGPRFHDLHALFELQYNEMWTATDEIAERIRALGVAAPNSYGAMNEAASLDADAGASSADEMVADLLKGHEVVVATIRKALELAGEHGDEATADVLTPRLTAHEKTAWMLRSTLG
ncbi:DNA starvation/stationary phase protection protein [Maricaulis sp.]|uniref:Dps family protein n=1 Tax=unclassified Maricaulis TaxID=2632371 RepID=UPI001B250E9B|nr:DNA starvation/stationary phase protection protein [Maricaulis sp.]MBO6797607.1 DNA starvation/stationary phase protection protein [Maricaulis sp.]